MEHMAGWRVGQQRSTLRVHTGTGGLLLTGNRMMVGVVKRGFQVHSDISDWTQPIGLGADTYRRLPCS